MKKLIIIFLLLLAAGGNLSAQTFAITKDTIAKDVDSEKIFKYSIKAPAASLDSAYKAALITITPGAECSLPSTDYTLHFSPITVGELIESKGAMVFVTLNKDSQKDRPRELMLKLKVTNTSTSEEYLSGEAAEQQLLLRVLPDPEFEALGDYHYLAYIGTNFDLVDGIKAKNLFFATNVYLPPTRLNAKLGYYLSLYGNRTLSSVDTSYNVRRSAQILPLTDSTSQVISQKGTLINSRVSDNIGAFNSMLMRLGEASDPNNSLQLFLAPCTEFIWRRNYTNTTFKDGEFVDTTIQDIGTQSVLEIPSNNEYVVNEFVWTLGPGIFLVHENDRISMRMHMSLGYTQSYLPDKSGPSNFSSYSRGGADIFFSGRAWITEAKSGITLQAEVTNSFFTPRPFYVVTLSKALDFKHIGSLFSPVVAR